MLIAYARDADSVPSASDVDATVLETDPVSRSALHELTHKAKVGDEVVVRDLEQLGDTVQEAASHAALLIAGGAVLRLAEDDLRLSRETGQQTLGLLRQAARLAHAADRRRWGETIAAAPAYAKGRPKTLNEDAIADALARGLGPTAIARSLGIHRHTVHRYAKRLASATPDTSPVRRRTTSLPKPKTPRGRPQSVTPEAVHALLAKGLTATQIAEQLGVSPRTVTRRLREIGAP